MAAVRHLGFLYDVNYAHRLNGSDEGHLQLKFSEDRSTASRVMTVLRNSRWPLSAILDFYMTSRMLSGVTAVMRGISG